jgi:plasmid stabilization system protein ParE
VIRLSRDAEQQLAALLRHYTRRGRPEAKRNLIAAIDDAAARIERDPAAGLRAPRPYPRLARPGRAWIKVGRYWITYSTTSPPVILGVFYATANIPRRL